MSDKKLAPYGSWQSAITTDLIVAGTVRLGHTAVDDSGFYWTEIRPAEEGRHVIVRWTKEAGCEDITPEPFNVCTRVHEYGGGDFAVQDGVIIFSNMADQRLYRQRPGEEPQPVTPEGELRFADGVFDTSASRFICVREDRRQKGQEPVNTIVALALDGQDSGQVLAAGNDFYATSRISPDGRQLAWLTWNHPHMPWDGTELWVADFAEDGTLTNQRRVAGGQNESVFQPQWSPGGMLHFVSDRSGWWNLYRRRDGVDEALHPMEAEFGLPQWVFGMRTYAFVAEGSLLCSIGQNGSRTLALLDTEQDKLTPLETPFTYISDVHTTGGRAYFVGGSPELPESVICLDLATKESTILSRSCDLIVEAAHLSRPRAVEFPTADGVTAFGFFYPPQNGDYGAPEGERPPLIVESHGGPTSATKDVLNVARQYWTNRGFAVLDVNYGGSTGYGRAYRERLYGQWGVVDVQDCINGARYLAEQGLVDRGRLAIHGGSAGGYTTLCALAFHDEFGAGASYFGVSDAEALAQETHKFESRYMDSLIGPYPEERDLYIERSPIHFADQIGCPLILFQGLDDPVVPASQAEMMFEAVKVQGVPVAYLAFPGERHGFRQAENIKRMLEGELYFYGRIFGFKPADEIEPVDIENL